MESVPPLAVNDFHQFQRLQFHFYHQRVYFGTEITIKNHAGNGHQNTERGVIECHGNTVSELCGIAATCSRSAYAKNFYHADQGAEQTHQRTQRSNGSQCGEITVKVMGDRTTRFFDGFFHDFARAAVIFQTCRKNLSQGRMFLETYKHIFAYPVLPVFLHYLGQQISRRYHAQPQGPYAFAYNARGDDGR